MPFRGNGYSYPIFILYCLSEFVNLFDEIFTIDLHFCSYLNELLKGEKC